MNFQIEQFDPSPAVELWCERNPGSAQKRRHATYTRPSTAAAEEDLQPLEESDEEEEGEYEEEGEEEFSQVVVSTAELDKLQGLVSCSLESSCTDDFFTCFASCKVDVCLMQS